MSATPLLVEPRPVSIAETPQGLTAIASSDVNLAVWRRMLPAALADSIAAHRHRAITGEVWFDACDSSAATEGHYVSLLRDVAVADRPLWAADIQPLVTTFARLAGAHVVRATLETVTGSGCRKFHVDHIGLRLLCTYDGAGTEWVPDEFVCRSMLAIGDNDDIVADRDAIESLACGDVGLFKGEAWPGNAGKGIVHRSPPEPEGGHRRVLLCLDAGMVDHSRLGRLYRG